MSCFRSKDISSCECYISTSIDICTGWLCAFRLTTSHSVLSKLISSPCKIISLVKEQRCLLAFNAKIYFPALALALRVAKAHKGLFGSESISILEYLYTQNVFGNLGISKGISKSQGI
jgi:hypothetical protein